MYHGQGIAPSHTKLNFVKLAAGICKQSIKDLKSSDPLLSVDALAFYLEPGAADLLNWLGFAISPEDAFCKAVLNGK